VSELVARASDPQAQLQAALDLSFSYLGHRDRTVAEVRRHLERKRVEPVGIDAAIAELERLDYLDDARFARRFAEDRRRLDAWGRDRIERRLLALGVEPAVAAGAIAEGDGHDEIAVAACSRAAATTSSSATTRSAPSSGRDSRRRPPAPALRRFRRGTTIPASD
jgi:regulatory protein